MPQATDPPKARLRLRMARVDARAPAMLPHGGYLPSIDHALPPICYYRAFWRFMDRIREHCGAPEEPFQEAGP